MQRGPSEAKFDDRGLEGIELPGDDRDALPPERWVLDVLPEVRLHPAAALSLAVRPRVTNVYKFKAWKALNLYNRRRSRGRLWI